MTYSLCSLIIMHGIKYWGSWSNIVCDKNASLFQTSPPTSEVDSPIGCLSSKYVVYATACVYRELYGKIADHKKKLCK